MSILGLPLKEHIKTFLIILIGIALVLVTVASIIVTEYKYRLMELETSSNSLIRVLHTNSERARLTKEIKKIYDKDIQKALNTKTMEVEADNSKRYTDMYVEWVLSVSMKCPEGLAREIVIFILENTKYPKLILSMIAKESAFDPFAYRKDTKVFGLGQIRYSIWKDEIAHLGITGSRELFDWKKNVLVINYIINKYYKQNKESTEHALLAYVGATTKASKDIQRKKYYLPILSNIGVLTLREDALSYKIKQEGNQPEVEIEEN